MTIDRHPDSLKGLIRDLLSDTGWEVFAVSYDSIDSLESVPLESIDAVLLAPARHFPVQYMDRLTSCKLMQIWSSGYDKFNIQDAHRRNIPVANNYGSNATSVAEHAVMMMLAVSRRAPEMHSRVVAGNWEGNDHGMTSSSLHRKTLGIVGLGNIGRLVAIRAEAFGMNILFSDPNESVDRNKAWKKVGIDRLFRESDIVSLHTHLNPDTRGMVDAAAFSKMRKKPYLVNVSRAELVERDALMAALEAGRIRGIAMDAHYEEPTKSEDPLLKTPSAIFSPHVAGSTKDSYADMIGGCIANIARAEEESAVQGLISPAQKATG